MRRCVRDALARNLVEIPIPRYKCPDHGWIPWLPSILLPFVRRLASVVEQVLDRYASGRSASEAARDLQVDEVDVRRWASKLKAPWVEAWTERMLDALRPARAAPEERPATARPDLWRVLRALRRLAAALEERGIAVGSPLCLLWSRKTSA